VKLYYRVRLNRIGLYHASNLYVMEKEQLPINIGEDYTLYIEMHQFVFKPIKKILFIL